MPAYKNGYYRPGVRSDSRLPFDRIDYWRDIRSYVSGSPPDGNVPYDYTGRAFALKQVKKILSRSRV